MNIIELFEKASVHKEGKSEFNFEDVVLIKKQFEIEKNQNPDLNPSTESDLISAINDYSKELSFLVNNRALYNFFSGKEYFRNHFSPQQASSENVKLFIEKFLSFDLEFLLKAKLNENKFEYLDDFLVATKEYLPQKSLEIFKENLDQKVDFALSQLDQNQTADLTTIVFIKQRNFYDLLSHFSSNETDIKVRALFDKVSISNNFVLVTQFLNQMMLSMSNYKTSNHDLANFLKINKEETIANTQKTSSSETSGFSGMSIGGIIVLIIFVIRIILVLSR